MKISVPLITKSFIKLTMTVNQNRLKANKCLYNKLNCMEKSIIHFKVNISYFL